jgi:site-specific recombinase XerD
MLDQGRALVTEKGEKSREVKFTGFTGALLDRWLEFRPAKTSFVFVSMATEQRITGDGIAHILKRLKTKAGIDDSIYAHGFRHGFAREFILNGGDIGVLAKLMGHSNINTTAAYYAIFREDELKGMHTQFSPLRILN